MNLAPSGFEFRVRSGGDPEPSLLNDVRAPLEGVGDGRRCLSFC